MSMCVWDVCAARARAYAVTCVNPGRAGREAPRPPRSGGLRWRPFADFGPHDAL